VATKSEAASSERGAVRAKDADFRAQERSIRDALDRERQEQGKIATADGPTEPDDAIAIARFIGSLRKHREEGGLSLADVADRSGIDKASLSRLENGWYPNPTVATLARYARAIGKRLRLELGD
jgi:DNA-binding XRE family transcriptional regulator